MSPRRLHKRSTITIKPTHRLTAATTCWLASATIAASILLGPVTLADTLPATATTDFYQLLHSNSQPLNRYRNQSLLDQVMPEQRYLSKPVAHPEHEDDLAFNYLWLQQHQDDYSHADGGAAAGKMFRMGIKALYRSYYGTQATANGVAEEDFTAAISRFDYRLRLSGDRVKLGVKYEF